MRIFLAWLFKNWRLAGLILLVAALTFSSHILHRRSMELETLQYQLAAERQRVAMAVKVRENDKDRTAYNEIQLRRVARAQNPSLILDDDLRAVYDSLRQRQSGRATR